MLNEKLQGINDAPDVQIFATDIDEDAIAAARHGLYTLNDAADVSPERLKRFFTKEKGGYRIRRELRGLVLFANHNLLKDPPFSRLDMITCRNLLIYFNPQAQERVLETFHFALKNSGYLFLGTSESIDGTDNLYSEVNREYRLFKSRQIAPRPLYPVPDLSSSLRFDQKPASANDSEMKPSLLKAVTYGDLHGRILEKFAPPSIIVNEQYEIVHISENAGRFLQIEGGDLSAKLFNLIKPELKLPVSTAVYQAVHRKTNVEAENLGLDINGQTEMINVSVRPVLEETDEAIRGFLLIVFEQPTDSPAKTETVFTSSDPIARQLEEELLRSQTQFRTSIEQADVQAEELKASNATSARSFLTVIPASNFLHLPPPKFSTSFRQMSVVCCPILRINSHMMI
ncbi:MAG: hypothetical protein M3405_08840 [Acidobacteriota bacterium]|nr:hypothetical protein [Acidobacteriota bacterium]